ncbi:proton-coupled folate transporter-like isoform X2 [Diorhabda carinulata]|nr:proton-coupled folate transporter-like isoform X2 [Diorhabda carinulata]
MVNTILKNCRFRLTIEIPLLLIYFTFMLNVSVFVNLTMYKTCYTLMGYPEVNCSRLGRYTDEETEKLEGIVQPLASYVTTITEMVPNSVPFILSLIIGSWSDKYGRKPAMMFVSFCISLYYGITAIIILFDEITPYMMMLATIPTIVCGSSLTIVSLILAYLNDIATPETRGMRNAAYEVITVFCICCANLLSPPLLYATNYSVIYGLSAVMVLLAIAYTHQFLPESVDIKCEEKSSLSKIFTCQHLSNMFLVIGKKRCSNQRAIIVILLIVMLVDNLVKVADSNIKTLYLRRELIWTLTDRNSFISWSSVISIICTPSITFLLQKQLKIKEIYLILVGIISSIGVDILYATAQNNWFIYGSVPVGILGGLVNPMLRTKLVHIIGPGEMGKIFSLYYVIINILSLAFSMFYSFVYNQTIDTNPGIFNWISIGIRLICGMMLIVVMVFDWNQPLETKQPDATTVKVGSDQSEAYELY